jgi:hypothetical protein
VARNQFVYSLDPRYPDRLTFKIKEAVQPEVYKLRRSVPRTPKPVRFSLVATIRAAYQLLLEAEDLFAERDPKLYEATIEGLERAFPKVLQVDKS